MLARLARLRERMKKEGLDALLISSLPNIRYLTSFTGSNALCVVTPRKAHFLTDSRYELQSADEVTGCTRHVVQGGLVDAAADLRLLAGSISVGFEANTLTYDEYRKLKRRFTAHSVRGTTNLVEDLAVTKDAGELSRLTAAARISDRVFQEIVSMLKPGIAEREIAAEITYRQRKMGADHDAFDPIVASGPHGALPHAKPSSKRIRNGELLILDFGCTVDGYGSDLTRTVCIGYAPRRARELYSALLDAQKKAVEAARPGMRGRELDAVARSSISTAGLGRWFTHSLGHGLGLRVHERPRISPTSTELLQQGNVMTIEPGLYIPGFGGIRIEDDIVLTTHGSRTLTNAPKELMIV